MKFICVSVYIDRCANIYFVLPSEKKLHFVVREICTWKSVYTCISKTLPRNYYALSRPFSAPFLSCLGLQPSKRQFVKAVIFSLDCMALYTYRGVSRTTSYADNAYDPKWDKISNVWQPNGLYEPICMTIFTCEYYFQVHMLTTVHCAHSKVSFSLHCIPDISRIFKYTRVR